MPQGFSSAARNLFLLGATGQSLVSNFFRTLDQSSVSDTSSWEPRDIIHSDSNEKYYIGGKAKRTSANKEIGFIESRDWNDEVETTTQEWFVTKQSVDNTAINCMDQDAAGNLIVGGYFEVSGEEVPFFAKYSTAGVLDWQSSTYSGGVSYNSVCSDSNNTYYACGQESPDSNGQAIAFVEKFDANGNPSWGKSCILLSRQIKLLGIDANERGEVVAVGSIEDDSVTKGFIIKIDTSTGEVLWDRTIRSHDKMYLSTSFSPVTCEDIYVDDNDQIYVVGRVGSGINGHRGFIIKYTAEGNVIWQKETANSNTTAARYYKVKADTETEQVVVYGQYYESGQDMGLLTKYNKAGNIVWRRTINPDTTSAFGPGPNDGSTLGMDSDPSNIYLLYTDSLSPNNFYTFGKVSSAGNGLGNFQYSDGQSNTVDYNTLTMEDQIGRLYDGSVSQNSSDLITYPFSANKILFDDLATQVSNKKRQMDSAEGFDYSGSPAIRASDFQELNLGNETIEETELVDGPPTGQAEYTTSGTFSWTAPADVTSVSVVAVGAGGGGQPYSGNGGIGAYGSGGGGGGLGWKNNISVTPGQSYTVVVGAEGAGGTSPTAGGDSYFINTSTVRGGGGDFGDTSTTSTGGTFTGDGGGNGGNGAYADAGGGSYGGGGGAGGYSGNGGSAAVSGGSHGDGSGGGGGGGFSSGGGVGIYGEGANGTGGFAGGTGGSGGTQGASYTTTSNGGVYGGGAGCSDNSAGKVGGSGGVGAVRIIWGAGRSFPSTLTADQTPGPGGLVEQTVTKAKDISGKGRHATIEGATQNSAGYWEFDGTNDNMVISKDDFTSSGKIDFSIESWFYFDSLPTLSTSKGYIWDQSPGASGVAFRASTAGDLTTFAYPTGGGSVVLTDSGVAIQTGRWYHAVSVFETNKVSLYVDGVLANATTNATISSVADVGNTDFFIGCSTPPGSEFMDGRIGDVRIYDRVLSSSQVFQNYNATKYKYINEAPVTAPTISDKAIVYDSNLILNYDFGNRATYDRAENLLFGSEDWNHPGWLGYCGNGSRGFNGLDINTTDVLTPFGDNTALGVSKQGSGCGSDNAWGIHWYVQNSGGSAIVSSGETYTVSVYLRGKVGGETIELGFDDGAESQHTLTTEWVRYTHTGTPSTGVTRGFQVKIPSGTNNQGFYIWHPQVESGSNVGRYVSTYGTSITASTKVNNLSSDAPGGLYTGTINGPTFNTDGSFQFDGTDDDIDTGLSWTPANQFSFTMWFNLDQIKEWHNLVDLYQNDTRRNFQLFVEGDGDFRIFWGAATDTSVITGTVANTWYFGAFTCNGETGDLYRYGNGTTNSVSATAGSGNYFVRPLVLGRRGDSSANGFVDGKIGEFQFYNRELTAAEVLQNYNATRSKYGV